jgi:hypothetical protein
VKSKKPIEIEQPFAPVTLAFHDSPAYRALRLYEIKVLVTLIVEWARQGVYSNGKIALTQRELLTSTGLTNPNLLVAAIANLAALRIIRITGHARKVLFDVTFLPAPNGKTTNEWQTIKTDEQARARLTKAFDTVKKEKAAAARNQGIPLKETFRSGASRHTNGTSCP